MDNIKKPITLKCGLTLPNRLAKAAMGEGFGGKHHLPGSKQCIGAYKEWAAGGWGMVMTGNVQVDPKYLGSGQDIVFDPSLPDEKVQAAWKSWASACSESGTKAIVQINHPGRQSVVGAGKKGFFEKNVAPSAVPLDLGKGFAARLAASFVFGTPREMTADEIAGVVAKFAATARQAAEAGFAGVEIHAAHGYLLAQFLSPKSNLRTDAYGGSAVARAKIVVEVVQAIRAAVPASFCVGVKLNSADHQKESAGTMIDCIDQIKAISDAGIDFLEISGGSYENPTMATGPGSEKAEVSASTKAREAYFLEFASAIRAQFPDLHLMVTGGFRTRQGMEAALAEDHCDMVGLGRPAVLAPRLPVEVILNAELSDEEAKVTAKKIQPPALAKLLGMKFVGAGTETMWYAKKIQELGAAVAAKLKL